MSLHGRDDNYVPMRIGFALIVLIVVGSFLQWIGAL